MARKDELLELTKAELQELAEEHDLSTEGNKPEIADRIVAFELGITLPEEDEEVEVEPVQEPEAAEEVKEEEKKLLLKFVGRNASWTVGSVKVSRKHPFVAVEEGRARGLLSGNDRRWRLANPDEVDEYYN